MIRNVEEKDLDALWAYIDGPAQNYFGMCYADGLRAVVEWLEGGERPDAEEE